MKTLIVLILGIAIGVGVVWYFQSKPEHRTLREAGQELGTAVESAGNSIQEKVRSWNLGTNNIREELAETGRVIRQKAEKAGEAIADATADARTTAAIKAKLVRDPNLSAWNISVNTTAGTVTLSGVVESVEAIQDAMALAMDTDGVRQVISTLQIKSKEPK